MPENARLLQETEMLLEGKTRQEMAEELNVDPKTVYRDLKSADKDIQGLFISKTVSLIKFHEKQTKKRIKKLGKMFNSSDDKILCLKISREMDMLSTNLIHVFLELMPERNIRNDEKNEDFWKDFYDDASREQL